MAEHFKLSVVVEGKAVTSIGRVLISQGIFEHHYFEVALPMRSLVKIDQGEDPFPALKACIGKDIEINLATTTAGDTEGSKHNNVFKGIVTNLRVSGNWWQHGMVSLVGKSLTVLMDTIPNVQAYSEQGIAAVYKSCVSKHLSSKIKLKDNITYTDKLRYTVQYEESDFNFIKRLCFEYGEWFYYDGENLCLGLDGKAGVTSIKRDRIRSLNYEYALASETPGTRVRDYKEHDILELKPAKAQASDDMATHALNESSGIFPGGPDCFVSLPAHASGDNAQFEKKQLQFKLDTANKVKKASVLTVTGETDMSELKLGATIKLEGLEHSGEFVVIQINHNCMDARNYTNHFKAIPKGSIYPQVADVKQPRIQSCSAVVVDNKDPKKWGRVKVQFDWSQDVESPWIRMAVPHAGDKRGFYFVPEVGDEVIVDFDGGRPEFPIVIGSLYNGKSNFSSSFNDKNNIKSIKTKSGNEIIFDDTGKLIFKNEHNTIELNCEKDGSIAITTNGDISISAAKNLAMSVGADMSVSVGGKLEVNVGGDMSMSSDGKGTIEAGKDLELKAASNLNASSNKDLVLKGGANFKASGLMTKVEGSTTAEFSSGAMTTVKGAMVKIN